MNGTEFQALLSLSPLILVGCLGFLLCVCLPLWKIYLGRRWDELLLKMRMGWKQRTISENSLTQRIASGLEPGTFIQESYTMNWPRARIWWTPDTFHPRKDSLRPWRRRLELE
jgi:hypothetical protein